MIGEGEETPKNEMELGNPSNGEDLCTYLRKEEAPGDHENPSVFDSSDRIYANLINGEIDSTYSTPYVSAPSSPGDVSADGGYFFSAPASPVHYILLSPPYSASYSTVAGGNFTDQSDASFSGSFEFEFSSRFAGTSSGICTAGSMITADELFLNGQIRPMKLSSHLAPLLDVDEEIKIAKENGDPMGRGRDLMIRSRSINRRARSMSPTRNTCLQWPEEEDEGKSSYIEEETGLGENQAETLMPSDSASSSRSSSGKNSKRWIFLKDLLYRSKSEGHANAREKFWRSIYFSPSKGKTTPPSPPQLSIPPSSQKQSKKTSSISVSSTASSIKFGSPSTEQPAKPVAGFGSRRGPTPSAHERHYATNRVQAEEMRKRTFLPYRPGLLSCLGLSSRSYGAMNGVARTMNSVSSR
ncbi:hypothetical protein AXF42_Ash016294 [Apostasia shenzhenica]|uniref:Uncharacterized protein n=1 Tax=Apostasia shenzhenica TaxID=1088818 RepID=A0A2H9ZXB3_9ASPA|nr:hypothetical protein AXF42_Ash016294 [Apostasia shenzhenica]